MSKISDFYIFIEETINSHTNKNICPFDHSRSCDIIGETSCEQCNSAMEAYQEILNKDGK